jgi:TPR repeat protein
MSTGRESSSDAQDASRFAPKWARDPEQNGRARRPARADGDIWLGDAEEAARDDFRYQEGDGKLGLFRPPLEPTVIPDVWSASVRRSNARRFVGLVAAVLAVAGVAFGVIARVSGSVSDESATRFAPPRGAPQAAADGNRARASTGRLAVSMPTSAFPPDEAAPLGLAIYGAGQRGDVVIGGYAPGSTFSAGQARGRAAWVLSRSQIDGVVITPPSGFAGAMDLLFELRLADGRVVDRKRARLEWSARPPVVSAEVPRDRPQAVAAPALTPTTSAPPDPPSGARTLSPAELAALLRRGNELVSLGDLVGARLVFERAAQAGDSRAALALASTYDPLVLQQLGERGLAPDIAMARFWYEKAKELGSKEAPERLEVLVSRSN